MTGNGTPLVVVGVDGSDLSTKAVQWADRYAQASGATLRLVTVWHWPSTYGAPVMMAVDGFDPSADARTILDKARAEVALPADRVEALTSEGQAGPVLVAASDGAEALVVGSRGHNPVSTVLLGSASAYCVHHAGCPVVVVR